MNKIWEIKEIDNTKTREYMNEFNVSDMLAKILIAKEISIAEVNEYLNPSIDKLYDPFLLEDMEKVVNRIIKARDNNEKVTIYGDYDVDGITSITILYSFLKEIGVKVSYYLPDRVEEGYGLNLTALKDLKNEGVSLVITVDCGISAINEIEFANEIGLDVCITDHHECGEILPNSLAIVNPKRHGSKYPFNSLAGVGVTFKVITALVNTLKLPQEAYLKYIDLVAVGTIADIVPLMGENRVITYNGLKHINETKNEGLRALMKISSIVKADSESVSFALAPRINASGRMADASVAVKLLLSESEAEAYKYAKVLDMQNKERQEVEKSIYDQAISVIAEKELDKKRTIVIAGKGWHQGVIGIVASKLTEKYLKPVILLAYEDKTAKGSGRIPKGVSLYEALSKCSDLLDSFGGHELAAGLSLQTSNIQEFSERFEQIITEMKPEEFVRKIEIDVEVNKSDISYELVDDISKIEPFGQKNRKPIFIYKNMKVLSICTLKDDKHLKLKLQDNEFEVDGIFFGAGARRDEAVLGDKIDVVFNLSVNEFMDKKRIQYIIIDFKKSV